MKMNEGCSTLYKIGHERCGSCRKFFECFNSSNEILGVTPEDISDEELDFCMKIPACLDYTPGNSNTE